VQFIKNHCQSILSQTQFLVNTSKHFLFEKIRQAFKTPPDRLCKVSDGHTRGLILLFPNTQRSQACNLQQAGYTLLAIGIVPQRRPAIGAFWAPNWLPKAFAMVKPIFGAKERFRLKEDI
jgi:hypothetical protein